MGLYHGQILEMESVKVGLVATKKDTQEAALAQPKGHIFKTIFYSLTQSTIRILFTFSLCWRSLAEIATELK